MSYEQQLPPDELHAELAAASTLAQLAAAGGTVVCGAVAAGAIEADGGEEQDTVLHTKISSRRLLIALWLNYRPDDDCILEESKALFECDEEFRDVIHSEKQIQRIAEITKHFPSCTSCGGWRRYNHKLRKEVWRGLTRDALLVLGKITNLDDYQEEKYYVSTHGRLVIWDEKSDVPQLSTAQPGTYDFYVRDYITNPYHDKEDPNSKGRWKIQRAVLVYFTFYNIPDGFIYPQYIIDHINEINFDNHIFNLHPLLQSINTVPRCSLPDHNTSEYIGVGQYTSGQYCGEWYYHPYKGDGTIHAGSLADALYRRFASEVNGGMYKHYSPSHIIEMILRRSSWQFLLEHHDGLALFKKTFVKDRVFVAATEADDGSYDEAVDANTPGPTTRRSKKVTPSPHTFGNVQSPAASANRRPPQIQRAVQNPLDLFTQGRQASISHQCETCSNTVYLSLGDHPTANVAVRYFCQDCKRHVIKRQSNNNNDDASLDLSIMHQLMISGKLPSCEPKYESNLRGFVLAHKNHEDIEIDRDGSTIDDLLQKYIDIDDDASFWMIMWGWYYNMDVYEWIEKEFGFVQTRVYLAEGEDTAHGIINICNRVNTVGDMIDVFDSLDFAFTSNGNSHVIENEDEEANQNGSDGYEYDHLDNNEEDELPRFFQLASQEEGHYNEDDLSHVTEQVSVAPEQCEVLDVTPSQHGMVSKDEDKALEHLVITKVAQVSEDGFMPGDIIAPPLLPNDQEYNAVITRKWYTNQNWADPIKIFRHKQDVRYNDEKHRHFDYINRVLTNSKRIIHRRLGLAQGVETDIGFGDSAGACLVFCCLIVNKHLLSSQVTIENMRDCIQVDTATHANSIRHRHDIGEGGHIELDQALVYFHNERILLENDVIGRADGNIFNSDIARLLDLLTNHDGKVGMIIFFMEHYVTVLKIRRGDVYHYKLIETLPQSELSGEGFVDECVDISILHSRLVAYAYKRHRHTTIHMMYYHAIAFARSTNNDDSNIDVQESHEKDQDKSESEESGFSRTAPDEADDDQVRNSYEDLDKAIRANTLFYPSREVGRIKKRVRHQVRQENKVVRDNAGAKKAKRKKKTCRHEGCTNYVQRNGVCIRHGAKHKRKTCRHEGCTNIVQNNGVCRRHGAKRKKKTCRHEGC